MPSTHLEDLGSGLKTLMADKGANGAVSVMGGSGSGALPWEMPVPAATFKIGSQVQPRVWNVKELGP